MKLFFLLKVKASLLIRILSIYVITFGQYTAIGSSAHAQSGPSPTKLSWFIPDGFRADPELFNIFKWAQEGKLPNIKRMMEMGSYGYSIPVFPSHTPANFAALVTGMYPKSNGVPDGPMRLEGQSLQNPAIGGFSSSARKVPAIWGNLGAGKSVVLSMPGSTPPELKQNAVTIRGRWGGWGADLHSVIYEKISVEQRTKLAKNSRLFMQEMELTQYIDPNSELKWPKTAKNSKELFLRLEFYGTPIYAKVQQLSAPSGTKYDTISFSRDMIKEDAVLKKGQWSNWIKATVLWNDRKVNTNLRFHVISVGSGNFFRIRVLADNLNDFIVEPSFASAQLESDVGPMVDFPDNFPPQLVYYPEDKMTFLNESKMSIDWHLNAVDSIYSRFKPDIFLHDIYTPNQMLTSRWWMGYIDPRSARYNDVSQDERELLWREVYEMYRGIDAIVGKTLDNADEDTVIVLSSDHGVIPLNASVLLNNLFAQKGWISYGINNKTGEANIDWNKSTVVFLKSNNIYINPNGLGPIYKRDTSLAYEKLRSEVIDTLRSLRDDNGVDPLEAIVKWEDVDQELNLPPDRTGDLVVANKAGFGLDEDITSDSKLYRTPIETGYKQAVIADNVKGLWAPFIIVGKGIKENHALSTPIRHVDQVPTIFQAMSLKVPKNYEGVVVYEIFK